MLLSLRSARRVEQKLHEAKQVKHPTESYATVGGAYVGEVLSADARLGQRLHPEPTPAPISAYMCGGLSLLSDLRAPIQWPF